MIKNVRQSTATLKHIMRVEHPELMSDQKVSLHDLQSLLDHLRKSRKLTRSVTALDSSPLKELDTPESLKNDSTLLLPPKVPKISLNLPPKQMTRKKTVSELPTTKNLLSNKFKTMNVGPPEGRSSQIQFL